MGQTNNSQRIKLAFAGAAVAAVAAGCSIASLETRSPKPDVAIQEPVIEQVTEQATEKATEPTNNAPATSPEVAEAELDSASPVDTAAAAEASEAGEIAAVGDSSSATTSGSEVTSETGSDVAIAPRPDSSASANRGPSVYWLGDNENQVEYNAERIAVAPNADAEAQLRTAMDELLTGSDATAIPPATKLLGAEVRGQDVYVDLSSEFTAGGGSSAMAARLGQVIYTATAVEPGAQVWISVDGEPLTELGGEGLLIEQPLNVAQFEEDFGI